MALTQQTETIPAATAAATGGKGRIGDSALAARLRRELEGEVLFDAFSRGRYSTDASIYQIEPVGVVVPRSDADVVRAIQIASEEGVPILPRGGGTSQCGQTVGEAIVLDVSQHLNKVTSFDPEAQAVSVQPGLVLDHLNSFLKPHGLMYPVDVSTSSRATLGGMAGNNSCGARSIRYGTMRDNVLAIDAILADGSAQCFGELSPADLEGSNGSNGASIADRLLGLGRREATEITSRFPKLMRRVGGYNVDALVTNTPPNLSHLLVGSEGTLAYSQNITLKLHRTPPHKVLGVCHFPTFYQAMDSARHIVTLDPAAVELVDNTMINLSREIPLFRDTVQHFVKGEPAALLLVEFAGEDRDEQFSKLKQLGDLMGELGFPGALVEATDPAFQRAIWDVRKAGLNIMMSMKGDGKPVSFIEDCAVALEDLADYTDRLTQVFHKHGTEGTWYAHASVGCLHVRPVLNLKQDVDVKKMRAIAEEAFAMVREYKGSHSGEHGDGLVRSEFHEAMFGSRMVRTFEDVKEVFDPAGLFNPGKIVKPPRMDDRSLFRFKPGYHVPPIDTALDWSAWNGFAGAVEMCNNNGACRKRDAAVMCPSYRVTGEEKDLTRGRANSLRLAISGQLGPEALTSDEMRDTMALCVGCKGCKRECPTGVDMARMKIEFQAQYGRRHGWGLRDKLIAHMPRYASWPLPLGVLTKARNAVPGLGWLIERLIGFSARRSLPDWHRDRFGAKTYTVGPDEGREVVLLLDSFNRHFEPEVIEAAVEVLCAAGCRVTIPGTDTGRRPLCCGRTYLSVGMVDQARAEATRLVAVLKPYAERGVPLIGLEPSCLLSLRDEYAVILPPEDVDMISRQAMLLEEFLAKALDQGDVTLDLDRLPQGKAYLHGHCHQKAFALMSGVESLLRRVPGLEVVPIESSCCGMAGAFGYAKETFDISMKMAEATLLPAIRGSETDALIVADGTSCRHQIHDGTKRQALHVAQVLRMALKRQEGEG